MKILLLCSAFNGLSQRAWLELRSHGHDVTVHLASDTTPISVAARAVDPDLIICPFLKDRVPTDVWQRHRTIIIHPGPVGDRGPSSLDWAITEAAETWGVTALQAVEEMDAGPIWATRTFPMDTEPITKSSLYNGPVADAAMDLIHEVLAKASDPGFVPWPLDYRHPNVHGRLRPLMRQSDRAFSWEEPTAAILRRIRAADGSPGVRATLAGQLVALFDAHRGPAVTGRPGTILAANRGAVLVATGDSSIWIGHARHITDDGASLKLAAATVLGRHSRTGSAAHARDGYDDISYERRGDVGVLTLACYNGALSTGHCRRLAAALRGAKRQATRVLLLRGGDSFSNGIHLNAIEAAADPAVEAWENINAIDDVCREIITCTDQLVVAAVGGNAGAGGVMLPLGADYVALRRSVVLNPHYATMGLYGSEYWTYVLPRRVGEDQALAFTESCLPIGADAAADLGLADAVVSGNQAEFEAAALEEAARLASRDDYHRLVEAKRERRAADERRKPLAAYRSEELEEMRRDIFDDRSGFAAARRAFVSKQRPAVTPKHIVAA